MRKRLQVSDLEGAAAGIADQSTLQRLLTPTFKLIIVRDVTHASRRVTAKPDKKTAAAAAAPTSVLT